MKGKASLSNYWKLPGTVLIGDGGRDWKSSSLSSFFSSSGATSVEVSRFSLLVSRSRLPPSTDDNEDAESPCLKDGVEIGLGFSPACDDPVAASCTGSLEASEAVEILLRWGFLTGS
jgi:hypothetical protein